jgi:hypothetical protein
VLLIVDDLLGARLVLSGGWIGMVACEDVEREFFSGLYMEDFLGLLVTVA